MIVKILRTNNVIYFGGWPPVLELRESLPGVSSTNSTLPEAVAQDLALQRTVIETYQRQTATLEGLMASQKAQIELDAKRLLLHANEKKIYEFLLRATPSHYQAYKKYDRAGRSWELVAKNMGYKRLDELLADSSPIKEIIPSIQQIILLDRETGLQSRTYLPKKDD